MKKFLFLLFAVPFLFVACGEDEDDHMHGDEAVDYEIHIESPDDSTKNMGDDITFKVEAHDHNGGVLHHFRARLYKKDTGEEVFSEPTDAHVHTTGDYEFEKTIQATMANGFEGHGDYIFEVKVWGHEAGEHEKMETVEFHVHM